MSIRLHPARTIKRNYRVAKHRRAHRFGLWQVNKLEPLKTKTFTVGSAHMKSSVLEYGSRGTLRVAVRRSHRAKTPAAVKIQELKIFDVNTVITTDEAQKYTINTQFEEQKKVFESKIPELLGDSRNLNKYVAIVDGKIAGSDTDKVRLAMSIYEKKGDVPMFVGKITKKPEIYLDTLDI